MRIYRWTNALAEASVTVLLLLTAPAITAGQENRTGKDMKFDSALVQAWTRPSAACRPGIAFDPTNSSPPLMRQLRPLTATSTR